ncbi:MAG: hypothetical protein WAT58_00850 [Candidatus Dormiibacterota bacterium]|jgi:cytochrome c biogenesis protein CcdA|nr:hypothetical protein [Candidatus Dormibacteraeota bacterium]
MSEFALRSLAILTTAFILLGFGIYFGTPVSDTYKHDYIFFGGGVISLLSGLATLGLFGMLLKQRQEYGDDITSDQGYPEMAAPPPNVGGAAARKAAADAAAESDDSESSD